MKISLTLVTSLFIVSFHAFSFTEALQAYSQVPAAARLLNAAEQGDCSTVSALLQAGANPNAKRENGVSALMLAAYMGHATCVQALLKGGANVNLRDDFGMTAMMMSVDPASVRTKQRIAAGKFRINGVDLAPAEKTIEWGKKIIDFRAEATVKVIRAATSG